MQVVLKWRRFLGILALQKRNINSKRGDPLEKQNKTVKLLLLIRKVRRISKNAFLFLMVRQLRINYIHNSIIKSFAKQNSLKSINVKRPWDREIAKVSVN